MDVAIYAEALADLNGRQPQYIIDANIDLTSVPRPWWGWADWFVPLETPLDSKW